MEAVVVGLWELADWKLDDWGLLRGELEEEDFF